MKNQQKLRSASEIDLKKAAETSSQAQHASFPVGFHD